MKKKYDVDKYNKYSIIQVASELGIIVRKNKCRCFLHHEKTPSLSFDLRRNIWKCFGCNEGGNVIKLVEKKLNCTFVEACEWLENKTFTEVKKEDIKFDSLLNKKIYSYILSDCGNLQIPFDYLVKMRKIEKNVVSNMNIRGINNIDEFYNKLFSKFMIGEIEQSGLITFDLFESNKTFKDQGIIIPFYNYSGELQTIQYRYINQINKDYRYVFPKNAKLCMFNEKILKQQISEVWLCEGAIDAMSLMTYGLNSVALPGVNNFNDEWLDYFVGKKVYIIFDNDDAGIKQSSILYEKFKNKNIWVEVRNLEKEYNDINEKLMTERSGRNGSKNKF